VSTPLDLARHFPPVSVEAWAARVQSEGKDPDALRWQMPDGILVKPFYTPEDVPYTTGPLWKNGTWQIMVRVTDNGSIKQALQGGATALSFGAGMTEPPPHLLEGVPLDKVSLHWSCSNSLLPGWLSKIAHTLRAKSMPGLEFSHLHGTMGRGATSIFEVAELTKSAADTRWRTVHVDVRTFHQHGASMVQELCFAVGSAAEILTRLVDQHGLSADLVARKLFYSVSVGTSYLPEIAKLRALRHLTTQLLEAYGVKSVPICILATTSQRDHSTCLDPATNIIRGTCQAMSAILGGCDTLFIPSEDRVPIQLLLQHEAQLGAVADPAAGAYYIESLTDLLGQRAWEMLKELEWTGGFAQALRSGYVDRMIRRARQRATNSLASGEDTLVGINAYPAPELSEPITIQDHLECFRAAAPFEHLRQRVHKLSAHLGRPLIVGFVNPEAIPKGLKALATRIMKVGGYTVAPADSTDDVDLRMQMEPASEGVIILSESPAEQGPNICPGCNMIAVLDHISANLLKRYGL